MIYFFFFNDTATTEIYTLSLHDALPIYDDTTWFYDVRTSAQPVDREETLTRRGERVGVDRKSTRLNSSHSQISYAVFCLKKKKNTPGKQRTQAYRQVHTLTRLACCRPHH